MKNLLLASLFLLGVSFVASCKKDNPDDPAPAEFCDNFTPSFSAHVLPIIERTCSDDNFGSCHGAASIRGDYTAFAGVKIDADNGKLESRAIVSKTMPPSSSTGPTALSNAQLDTLSCWLSNGAPNN